MTFPDATAITAAGTTISNILTAMVLFVPALAIYLIVKTGPAAARALYSLLPGGRRR